MEVIERTGKIVSAKLPLAANPAESLTDTDKLNAPALVGVPESIPLLVRLSPGGKPVAETVYDELDPPEKTSCWEYRVLTMPGGSVEACTTSAG